MLSGIVVSVVVLGLLFGLSFLLDCLRDNVDDILLVLSLFVAIYVPSDYDYMGTDGLPESSRPAFSKEIFLKILGFKDESTNSSLKKGASLDSNGQSSNSSVKKPSFGPGKDPHTESRFIDSVNPVSTEPLKSGSARRPAILPQPVADLKAVDREVSLKSITKSLREF